MARARNPILLSALFGLLVMIGVSAGEGAWKAPAKADKYENPVIPTKEGLKAGKDLYKKFRCIKCHGEGGKGDGIKGKQLVKSPSDLTGLAARGVQSDGALFWKITEGRKPMPSYKKAATKTERWLLVNYIRHLADSAQKEQAEKEEKEESAGGGQTQPEDTSP